MTAPTELPDWPGAMRKATAAKYCDLSINEFTKEVDLGRLPESFLLGGKEHWLRRKLDETFKDMTDAADWPVGSSAYVEKA